MPESPLTPPSPVPPKPSDDSNTAAKPKRRGRWRKRLGITALVLVVLALVINGPGARWIITKVMHDRLAEQDLNGEFTIEGSLATGLRFLNVTLEGSGPLQKIRVDKLALSWRLGGLWKRRYESIEISGVRVVLEPADTPEEEEKKDWREAFQPLRDFREIAISGALMIEDVGITILTEDQEPRDIVLGGFSHAPGSGFFEVTGFTPGKILPTAVPAQDFTLQWNEEEFILSEFVVVPGLQIEEFALAFPAGGIIEARTALEILEKVLEVHATGQGSLSIRSKGSALQLADLNEALGTDYPIAGRIEELNVEFTNLLEHPDNWKGHVAFRADGLKWDGEDLPKVVLTSTIADDDMATTVKLGEELVVIELSSEVPDGGDDKPIWEGHEVATLVSISSIQTLGNIVTSILDQELPEALPEGSFRVEAPIVLSSEGMPESIDAKWATKDITWREQPLPSLSGSVQMRGPEISADGKAEMAEADDILAFSGGYHLEDRTYQGDFELYFRDSAWLGPLALPDQEMGRPTGPLGVKWDGRGDLTVMTHAGNYDISTVSVKAPEKSSTNASLKGNYDWPKSVEAESLSVRNGQLQLSGAVTWSPHIVNFKEVVLEDGDGELARIDGRSPANPNLEALFQTEDPVNLTITSKTLTLDRIRTLIPMELDPAFKATVDTDLKLTGPPADPALTGTVNISGIQTPFAKAPPLALAANFDTQDGRLQATSILSDTNGALAKLEAGIPVKSQEWADNPEALKSLPFSASLKIETLDFSRLQSLSDALAEAEGNIDVNLTASGTMTEPTYEGTASVNLSRYPLPTLPHREVRDTTLKVALTPGRVLIAPSTCVIAGGKMTLSGEATYAGSDVAFDVGLKAENALLWRDELMVARTTGSIKLAGDLEEAQLSGELGIVDSLFYKDLELIPLRPAATVSPPSLPTFDTRGEKGFSLPVPEQIADWTIDLKIKTTDPFLVRGNLATGDAIGDIAVGGTFARPRPSGRIELKNAKADLPFSDLTISRGVVVLRPDHPIDPAVEIRGRTVVDSHDINFFISGPVSRMTYNLVSDPPLPDTEIMSLVSTGTTTDSLTDPDLAQARAFQLLLDDSRRRANSVDAGPTMKLLRGPLNAVDDLNLAVGQQDQYTGRNFDSATIDLSDKWSATFQIDDEGNTRGLLRLSLRSK